jgi:hypothetical protein
MFRLTSLLFIFTLVFSLSLLGAEPWSGIINSSRAVSWTNAGAAIQNYTTVFQSFTSSATAAQINTAIASCPDGQVVFLAAGTYNLDNGLLFQNNNMVLRGAGANATKLIFTGSQGCFFSSGAAMCINSGENNYGPNGGVNSTGWSSGYSVGTSSIVLASTPTSLAVGDMIILDQTDDTVDGYPSAGDIVVGQSTANGFSKQGGNTFGRPGRSQQFPTMVTSISGTTVGIWPPLNMPNWRSAKTPQAWWGSNPPITNVGIENLSMDYSSDQTPGFLFFNAANCWVKGVRGIITTPPCDQCTFSHVRLMNVCKVTVRDSYFWGPELTGTDHYGITAELASHLLIENNIEILNPGAFEHNGADSGSVWAYNYHDQSWVNSILEHEAGISMNLYEGNDVSGASGDIIHGTANFETFFRNYMADGAEGSTGDTVFWLSSYHRFYNIIGNVLGDASNARYEGDINNHNTALPTDEIYELGNNNEDETGSGVVSTDPRTKTTLFRWGNWDSVNSAVRFDSSEVPSSIANFANAVPASQTLPASFYLSTRPSFWGTTYGTPRYPAIGPDVTSGTLGSSGKAYKIPARLVHDNLPTDTSYGALGIKQFNATNYFAPNDDAYPTNRRGGLVNNLWAGTGIPGGWSHVSTIFQTFSAGATASQINSAISSCPSNQVVFLNAGTYNLGGGEIILAKNGVVLRGATNSLGVPAVILTNAIVRVGAGDWPSSNWGALTGINITSGLTEGSTSITLASTPGSEFALGDMFMVDQLDDGTFVIGDIGDPGTQAHRSGRSYAQLLHITNKVGTTIQFEPPLLGTYWNIVGGLDPEAIGWSVSQGSTFQRLGLENIKMEPGSAPGNYNCKFVRCYASWIRNCDTEKWPTGSSGSGIECVFLLNCNLEWNKFHDQAAVDSSSYAIQLRNVSSSRVHHNIFTNLALAIPTSTTVGCSISYNIGVGPFPYSNPPSWLAEYFFTHGGHSHHNLFEGNWLDANVEFDQVYLTSDSENGIVRNRIRGFYPGKTGNLHTIIFEGDKDTNTVLGNILGTSEYYTSYSQIYDIPVGNLGTILTNNWNSVNGGVNTAETLGANSSIRDSYIWDSKPAEFAGLQFPSFPVASATTNSLYFTNQPAGFRLYFGFFPSDSTPPEPPADPTPKKMGTRGKISIPKGSVRIR